MKKGAVYALVAVSMNLLNGFTGLFSLGQAGFMLLGAYTYAILTIPVSQRDAVYYIYNGYAEEADPGAFLGSVFHNRPPPLHFVGDLFTPNQRRHLRHLHHRLLPGGGGLRAVLHRFWSR